MSYNYFESPNEPDESKQQASGSQAETGHATNFRFGDSLLSSSGDVERTLSSAELEAIQNQFLSAEHPVVPLAELQQRRPPTTAGSDPNLARLLESLRAGGARAAAELERQVSAERGQPGELLKALASGRDEVAAAPTIVAAPQPGRPGARLGEKKKSLIVYLNHPRPVDMTRAAGADEEGLAQLISEQTSGDPFVSAKEFDAQGLSKETKHLNVASLRGLGVETKDAHDKDGLSVVVIGDAYKYKKIVLLISSKTGGLKFIPMVKDMRR